jgi:hypothetical protein
MVAALVGVDWLKINTKHAFATTRLSARYDKAIASTTPDMPTGKHSCVVEGPIMNGNAYATAQTASLKSM